MTVKEHIKKISFAVKEHISLGLVPDNDTIDFIRSAYGLVDADEISSFIESGDDGGAVIDLISYPADVLRDSIEKFIPPQGLLTDEIKFIKDNITGSSGRLFILLNDRRIFLPDGDTLSFYNRFLQRLNLDVSLNYIDEPEISVNKNNIFKTRALLRKKKFISGNDGYLFMNDLIQNYYPVNNVSETDLSDLVNAAADFLNGSDERPFDILSEKKYFYENAMAESEHFDRMLKAYSMEFIMMKKIQPPLISIDEARLKIQVIDRLTSIVYRMVIPSVMNVIIDR